MNLATCAVFFCSGVAALLFETLWFRQAGLVLGNTVWASALVTAAFMGGLALGNAFAIKRGFLLERPLRVFAFLELVVAITGVSLVLVFPYLSGLMAPLMSRLQETAAMDALRLVVTFALLVGPAAAMGATLPVLARSLGARDANFGRLLGRLYGWNTLGAVTGALIGEWFLIRIFGVAGTGLIAGALDLLAAAAALMLDRKLAPLPAAQAAASGGVASAPRLGAAAFLAGASLLALEVVWFRFLLLFTWATTGTFAVMLAIVLLGIALGSLLASVWLGRRPHDARHVGAIAAAAGIAVLVTYASFDRALPSKPVLLNLEQITVAALWLMLPVSALSGALFAFLGHHIRAEEADESRAAGVLTLANTIGAMLGSLFGGFVFLPLIGIERSILLLACAYAAVAILTAAPSWRHRALGLAAILVAVFVFPMGAMNGRFIRYVESSWSADGSRLVAAKEGLTETVLLLRHDSMGQPLRYRLLTNGMGMSTTDYRAQRYMGLYAWLPVALHPGPRSAVVISYGLGNTARALVANSELTRIDVVDVSADVLGMAPRVWPGPGENPLKDPRIRVHIEDGRFFLLTSRDQFDVITGEPPPPKSAGIGALYSREYFALMRERLREGGIVSYWLPVLHLKPAETLAVTRGFCDVFTDCSLWTGYGHEWMLVGTRGARGPASAERFARQWSQPAIAARLKAAGLPTPAEMGATFLADAAQIDILTRGIAPLTDNYPYRLDPRSVAAHASREYADLMDVGKARERFRQSVFIRGHWPEEWIEPTLNAFSAQFAVNRQAWAAEEVIPRGQLADLEAALKTGNEAVTLWMLGTSAEEQALAARAAAGGFAGPELIEVRAAAALAQHDYAEAESLLATVEPQAAHGATLRQWRILAAHLAGNGEHARRLLASAEPFIRQAQSAPEREAWIWLSRKLETPR